MKFPWCFLESFKGVAKSFRCGSLRDVSKAFQGCFKKVLGVLRGSFEEVLRELQGCFKKVLRMIQGSFRPV